MYELADLARPMETTMVVFPQGKAIPSFVCDKPITHNLLELESAAGLGVVSAAGPNEARNRKGMRKVPVLNIGFFTPQRILSPFEHKILNELFLFEIEEDRIVLFHEKWSLTGEGASLLDAELDLLSEAKEIAKFYLAYPFDSLDIDAQRLQSFLYNVVC